MIHFADAYRYGQSPHRVFPVGKNAAVRDLLVREALAAPEDLIEHGPASWDDIERVHDADYVERIRLGTLRDDEIRRFGFPFTDATRDRSLHAVGGTIAAAEVALARGWAANLAGGSHHARPDAPAGFCLLNDVGVAAMKLLAEGRIERALVIDLDVHQGDGTALVFRDEPRVTTLSVHGAKNFPSRKEQSDVDVPLEDGVDDRAYLDVIEEIVGPLVERTKPDLIFYNAGVDVHTGDELGRLALTRDGIHERDRHVLTICEQRGIPVAIVLGGGYAGSPETTADLHAIVFREALRIFGRGSARAESA